jgi:hypothetical protein
MNTAHRLLGLCLPVALAFHATAATSAASPFEEACDGSAVVSVGDGHFLNATDEDNVIRLYRLGQGRPVRSFDQNGFLRPEPKKKRGPKEVDIEAVARLGDRLYWIGSHGNDGKGQRETSRERLFATTLTGQGATATLAPVGKMPYAGLLGDFRKIQGGVGQALGAALNKPPKEGGISIEGLAADGSDDLLIGFRSPLVGNQAIVLPLHQAADLVQGGAAPRLGTPMLLDLQGRGIRAIEAQPKAAGTYWVLAGPAGSGPGTFQLYEWRPGTKPMPLSGADLSTQGGGPEGLMVSDAGELLVARDGGDVQGCKDQPLAQRRFEVRPAWSGQTPPAQAAR